TRDIGLRESKSAPISKKNLIKRINRALTHQGQILRTYIRNSKAEIKFGNYYLENLVTHEISNPRCDLDAIARDRIIEQVDINVHPTLPPLVVDLDRHRMH